MAALVNKSTSTSNAVSAPETRTPSMDIPKPRDAGHLGVTRSLPNAKLHTGIPTPPSSLSPTLPPHKLGFPSALNAPTSHSDSDIEPADTRERSSAPDRPQALSSAALSGVEAAGAITPAMLARDHLPDLLLNGGPMAIRHVLGHLCQVVPGFSRIQPAKARRIVVNALECRGGGGVDGDVLFEKVGWGRWDARKRCQPTREGRSSAAPGTLHESAVPTACFAMSPPPSVIGSSALSSAGLQIPKGRREATGWSLSHGSWEGSTFSRDDEGDFKDVAGHEADKMSLDGRDDTTPEQMTFPPADDDETEEEDWQSIGPEALRLGTYSRLNASRRNSHTPSAAGRRISKSGLSADMKRVHQRNVSALSTNSSNVIRRMSYASGIIPPFQRVNTPLATVSTSTTMQGVQVQGCDSQQEREAIAALLQMGTM